MSTPAPFLRTLAPLLRGLEKQYRAWLDAPGRFPVSTVHRAEIEGATEDLKRKADALDVDRPLLVIVLMGGTGVGKSTLLNALAGGDVAIASVTRPTTRDPVVYFHRTVPADRLDPAMRLCRLAQHDRPTLADKVIVDTPDLDSNDLENRDKLLAVLPVADVVLYVGSQEKYHDRLGWDLFRQQRTRRAFGFVLNKWDRCVTGESGVRPDDDLLKDLKAEGFDKPRLFRTAAQLHLDGGTNLPAGEQFLELVTWLETGLTRLEIDAVKARGVGQLLDHAAAAVTAVMPPDLTAAATAATASWAPLLEAEADTITDVLIGSLDPYQNDVEHQFGVAGQHRFRGLMAAYLRFTTKLRYVGSTLRDRLPLGGKSSSDGKADDVDLLAVAQTAARAAGERVIGQRTKAFSNRLIVDGGQRGVPAELLAGPVEAVAKLDWDDRFTRAVVESLADARREAVEPTGWRRAARGGVSLLANFLPEAVLIAAIVLLLYRFMLEDLPPTLMHLLLPVYVTLGVLIVLHVVITFTFPVRWPAIRNEVARRLGAKVRAELSAGYAGVPGEVAAAMTADRDRVAKLTRETAEVSQWLAEREQAAHVADLYGT